MLFKAIQIIARKLFPSGKSESESRVTLFRYMEEHIRCLNQYGQCRTAETYRVTLNSLYRFRGGKDLYLNELDADMLQRYEFCLKEDGLCPNTVSFYLKRIRAVYNKAVDEGLVQDSRPFRKVSTASEKTLKRAIPLSCIRRLKDLDLDDSPSHRMARDMFLLSFYMRGMSFVDMAHLRKEDLKDDVLTYRRRKTGQLLVLRWEPCIQKLAHRYASSPSSPYLLSIIPEADGDTFRQYHAVQTRVNRYLKEVGQSIGLTQPLTMYVARHSWASIAHREGVPVSVISEGMGHDSESTTQIYLASLESNVIDQANRRILKLL